MKLNLGCGEDRLEGYTNIDLYTEADLKQDARDLSQFSEVDEILAKHLIEHFQVYEADKVIKEWHRALKVGGKLIIETPDMELCCKAFEKLDGRDLLLTLIYGAVENTPSPHRWGWTFNSLSRVLKDFKDITRTTPTWGENNMRIEATK